MIRDVIVIGAGLAGSGVATQLATQGWDVLLLERDHFPRHKVCGEFLSPEAQHSLQALGLYTRAAALSPSLISQARFVSRRGFVLQMPLPGCAWGVSRYALDAALATGAQQAGAELRTGVTVRSYQAVDGAFAVQTRDANGPAEVHARTVIAACGRHTQTGLPPETRSTAEQARYVGVKCHFEQVELPAQVELFMLPGGYVGINPIEGGRVNVCFLVSYATFAQAGKRVDTLLEAAAQWNPAFGQRLAHGHFLPETAAVVAPVDTYRPAAPWAGMACIGDTAAMIPPLCGDGMAMALRSAELCGPLAHDFLRGSLSLADWEACYRQRWFAEFSQRLHLGRLLQNWLNVPLFSDLLVGVGHLAPPLAQYLVQATRG
ncbi:MAG: NAD(P)/FAD-dependent oxidoreductase [Chloroflexi bacterium]|nr:NAD(P)/FAD-dependent oxidoreductase [Chloroflexota bacterium]